MTKGINQGKWTDTKQEHLANILDMHMRLSGKVISKNPYFRRRYHYLDATSGDGTGSVAVFERLRQKFGLECHADFIELEETHFKNLEQNVQFGRCHLGDCKDVIPRLIESTDAYQIGLIYFDHNTPSEIRESLITMQYLNERRPRMELLVYIPMALWKRAYHLWHLRLSDLFDEIGKKYWLIREPLGKHQWTFLLGSNSDLFKDYRKISFYRLESKLGQEIFEELNWSHRERKKQRQPYLIEPIKNI